MKGLRTDGEKGLHYLLRDFAQLLLDESGGSGWGQVVREAREKERQAAEREGGLSGAADVGRQPLLDVGNRLVSHLISVSSCPEGKTAVLRANVVLVVGLVGLFGDAVVEQRTGDDGGATVAVEGHRTGRCVRACVHACVFLSERRSEDQRMGPLHVRDGTIADEESMDYCLLPFSSPFSAYQ